MACMVCRSSIIVVVPRAPRSVRVEQRRLVHAVQLVIRGDAVTTLSQAPNDDRVAPLPAVQFGHSGETQQPLRFDVVAGEQTFQQFLGQMRRIVDVQASPSLGMSSHAGPPGDLPSGASIDWPVRFTVTRLHGAAACDTAPVPESSMRKKFPKFSWQLMTGRRIAHDNGRCHQCPRINARLKRKSRP